MCIRSAWKVRWFVKLSLESCFSNGVLAWGWLPSLLSGGPTEEEREIERESCSIEGDGRALHDGPLNTSSPSTEQAFPSGAVNKGCISGMQIT